MITEGLHILSLEEYLNDPAPEPSLNASLAKILLAQSPAHARLAHPKLCPDVVRRINGDHFDLGTVVHELVLEGTDRICEIPANDYRTNAAKQARAEARAAGKIPLLTEQMWTARAMAAAIHEQVEAFPEPQPLRNGLAERVLIWKEGAIWCRARLDWLHTSLKVVDDLKTTGESGHPAEWARKLFDRGHDLQVAFHTRAVQKVTGELPEFRFVVIEAEPPYAMSLIGLDPEALEFAHTRMLMAIELWARCLRTGQWPGYPRRTVYSEVPPYVKMRWVEQTYFQGQIEEARHDAG